jgi:hypothetical protein
LFNGKEIASAFCEFDFSVIRVTPHSVHIPPAGYFEKEKKKMKSMKKK